MKIAAKIIKTVLLAAVVAIVVFLLWRIFTFNSVSVLGDITPTENAREAYASGNPDAFMTNKIHDRISGNEEGADGYFSAFSFVYIPEAKEVQVTVRVNDSTSEKLALPSLMPYFYLKFNENGDDTGEIRECSYFEDEHKLMYSYRRLVFEDVEITDITNLIICLSDTGETDACVSELVIHFQEQPLEKYKLSGGEKKSLENGD